MRVSRRSWHYRWFQFLVRPFAATPDAHGWTWWFLGALQVFAAYGEPRRGEARLPPSLCGYFWSLVALTALVPMLVFSLVVTFVVGAVAAGFGFVAVSAFRTARGALRGSRRGGRRLLGRPAAPQRERFPNPVVEYVKARKRRVCPLIDVVD